MNQPPRSGNKILYVQDNQSSRPPPASRGETFLCSISFIPKAQVEGYGEGGQKRDGMRIIMSGRGAKKEGEQIVKRIVLLRESRKQLIGTQTRKTEKAGRRTSNYCVQISFFPNPNLLSVNLIRVSFTIQR